MPYSGPNFVLPSWKIGMLAFSWSMNSRTSFFFDVYKAGSNELLYSYQIQANRSEKDDVTTYQNLCEQFYKNFERSIGEQQKKDAKADKKK